MPPPSENPTVRPVHLFLPLLSSLLYVVAALFLKQAASHQVGPWRTAFVCNWITAILFLLLLPFGGTVPSGALFWQPAVVALLFMAGQICTFIALDRGDVSIATPVLGAKVILVAAFVSLIARDDVPTMLWIAAAFSCGGIAFLNRGSHRLAHHHVGRTMWFAFQAAAAYALFDVLVMVWAPAWGIGRFLPIMLFMAAVMSFVFVPLFRQPLHAIPHGAWRPLLLGALFIALQAIILICTLAHFGDATAVNVIYSSRGLWSVLAVWSIGRWFQNTEHQLGGSIFQARLVGAILLMAAIVFVALR